jgi:hypothetical protein
MRIRRLYLALCAAVFFAGIPAARAVSCTTQSVMTPAQRTTLTDQARSLGQAIAASDAAAVKLQTIGPVAAQFESIAQNIRQAAEQLQGAAITVSALYILNASEQKTTTDTQFFCSVSNSAMMVTVSIPQLPPASYALAILHATGVASPQQITLLLQNDPTGSASWKLAGLFFRPLTFAEHDGVWYWKQARDFAAKGQKWSAYFYYQIAAFLLNPVDMLSSPNLEKLQNETAAVQPANLPGARPLNVSGGNGKVYAVTDLHTDLFSGGLDLVVHYQAANVSDPVATRAEIIGLMTALLAQHPEFRQAFHGLWVYAVADNQQNYAIELPMSQIP